MKPPRSSQLVCITFATIVLFAFRSFAATLYVDVNSTNPVAPYTNWATAANVIQDAVDAAGTNDTVLVTNGTYSTGGKVMAGDLTNRVALDKPITLQSVNGPDVTIIQGQGPVGSNAVRCAWMTNGATLNGFRLLRGATRLGSGSATLAGGGGVWCASASCFVNDCILELNEAGSGGGSYSGTLNQCKVFGNSAGTGGGASAATINMCIIKGNRAHSGGGVTQGVVTGSILQGNQAIGTSGGGASSSTLNSCAVIENTSVGPGGGTQSGYLYNCTVTRNRASGLGGGCYSPTAAWNSIVFGNSSGQSSIGANYYPSTSSSFRYSCTAPLPLSGTGNISADPQLLPDGTHLSETSPCRGAGSATYSTGTDIDGQSWTNPPSMGCDEWYPNPVISGCPEVHLAGPVGSLTLEAVVGGAEPFQYRWLFDEATVEDGGPYTNAQSNGLEFAASLPAVAGAYQMVASNAYGVVTGQVTHLKLHFVRTQGTTPSYPYDNWESAATNIQGGVDAASYGAVVVVTNGTYASGGRPDGGDLTNRVVIDKDLTVVSVNGAGHTIIQGGWDPVTTNGPLAVRCVKLNGAAALKGFTLSGGATFSSDADSSYDRYGGGVYQDPTGAGAKRGTVLDCLVTDCRANAWGGGGYGVTVYSSGFLDNSAGLGGGVANSLLYNCFLRGNSASSGGAAYSTPVYNCTITENTAVYGGGVSSTSPSAYNSIMMFNSADVGTNYYYSFPGSLFNCCTTPLPVSGVGNTDVDPKLVDARHLSPDSPCRGSGSTDYATFVDIDGEVWLNPPSIGCDEVYEADLVGPLSVSVEVADTNVVQGVALWLTGLIEGRAASLEWDFDDGVVATNVSYITSHTWTNAGDYTVTFTAYNTDNPGGVNTNVTIHVLPLESPELTAGSYSTNSTFSLEFTSQTGVGYIIEQATNLVPPVVWSTLTTRAGNGGVVQVTDTSATNTMRFYRVSVP